METSGGILGRLGEKVLGWIAFAAFALLCITIWQMPAETKTAIWQGVWKTIVWLIIAAALPWSGQFFMRRLLERSSNWAGAGLIASLTGVNLLLGLWLLGGLPAGGWGWLAALAALTVAGAYNFLVSEYLAERVGG